MEAEPLRLPDLATGRREPGREERVAEDCPPFLAEEAVPPPPFRPEEEGGCNCAETLCGTAPGLVPNERRAFPAGIAIYNFNFELGSLQLSH